MPAPKFTEFLEQTLLIIDDEEYLVNAMAATDGLAFMEKYQSDLDEGKSDFKVMKGVICKYVSKDNKDITPARFDTIFARRYMHLQKLYAEVIKFNFYEVFQAPDTEE